MMNKTPVIAVDGPAASGKGTLCRLLSTHFHFDLLDTGLLYRATAAHCTGLDLSDEEVISKHVQSLSFIDTNQADLRSEDMGSNASKISAYPAVRSTLLNYQRDFAQQPPKKKGAILDGRDIGTVICPETPYKLYLIASAEQRAERRFLEMQRMSVDADYASILADVQRRDHQDQSRTIAPLKPADDAKIIETTLLNAEQVFDCVIEYLYLKGLRV